MINLFIFICSMFIQFGTLEIPVRMQDFVDVSSLASKILANNNSPSEALFFADSYNDIEYIITCYQDENTLFKYYSVYFNANSYNSSYGAMSFNVDGYSINNETLNFTNLGLNNYICFQFWVRDSNNTMGYNGSVHYNSYFPSNPYYTETGGFLNRRIVASRGIAISKGEDLIAVSSDYVIVDDSGWPDLGSLSGNGHSSGGNPLEELESFSWDKNTHVFNSTGHSTGVSSSAATYNFSNPEQNLLGQIVDNTNGIISNTNNIGGALETINNNVINSAVALYNGMSQFNHNLISSYVYDEEKVDEALTNSSMFAFASATTDMTQTIINESDVLLDAVHDMEEKQDLVIYLDLTKWKVPVYSSSTGVNTTYINPYNEVVQIDFSFLKETKSIWQPLLLGILYLSLFLSIYFDLPNILRGANA